MLSGLKEGTDYSKVIEVLSEIKDINIKISNHGFKNAVEIDTAIGELGEKYLELMGIEVNRTINYMGVHEHLKGWSLMDRQFFEKYQKLFSHGLIIDLGGYGKAIEANSNGDRTVYALDNGYFYCDDRFEHLKNFEKQSEAGISSVIGDMGNLPFKNKFDTMVGFYSPVSENIEEIKSALKETGTLVFKTTKRAYNMYPKKINIIYDNFENVKEEEYAYEAKLNGLERVFTSRYLLCSDNVN